MDPPEVRIWGSAELPGEGRGGGGERRGEVDSIRSLEFKGICISLSKTATLGSRLGVHFPTQGQQG